MGERGRGALKPGFSAASLPCLAWGHPGTWRGLRSEGPPGQLLTTGCHGAQNVGADLPAAGKGGLGGPLVALTGPSIQGCRALAGSCSTGSISPCPLLCASMEIKAAGSSLHGAAGGEAAHASMALYNNGADVPSPQEASNGFSQPGASGSWHKGEEEVRLVEPSLVKKAHREILDHERKRRVELKCMELQEMMEEQGYSEEEIRQKVGTFRQMLMEKEGVLTREDQHGRQIVIENHHGADEEEYTVEYPDYGEDCLLQCDCSAECYREDSGHREYRLKRRSSSSASPPPKKKKKKKSGHRRSRKKRKPGSERSCDSSSPIRKEKKKKTGKKHRRDRSESGSRKKRRHRSRSPKNKRKEKNKERKRSRSESPAWRSHRRSSCSSHSASLSSDDSGSKSPGRLSPKRRQDGPKGSSARSSRSPSSPSPRRSASPHQNGHKGSAQNGRHSHGAPLPEPSDPPI
uniref:Serine/arginine repetitive matrix 3 n=1 Tax=Accipiter nisus TaxID=211598 RepID=A0A8B9N3K7_9AVES